MVAKGEHRGRLIVQQHRYFVQGGSYDYLYLYTPDGQKIGLVAGSDVEQQEIAEMCRSL